MRLNVENYIPEYYKLWNWNP